MARYALVVGITQYNDPYSFPNLTKPARDAEAVARLLDERGGFDKIVRVPEGWNSERNCPEVAANPVTSEQLIQALQTFLKEVGRGDALIYFSGHGFVVTDKLSQEDKGYLVTSDSQIDTIGLHGAVPFDSLNDFFHKANLSSLVLLLDCCHAGSYLERDLVGKTLAAFGRKTDYYLIAACRTTEKAYEGEPEQENSVFTEALLEGLAQERADKEGNISCDSLFDYIYKSKKLRNFGQQPIHQGLGGSITLVSYPVANKEPVTLNRHNPYQGLRAFESEQAQYFYGRKRVIDELLVRLNKDRFLSVIGPSGSGKSSLVKAGLLPQLKSDRIPESSKWEIESFTPGRHPLTPLQEIFARQHRRKKPYVLFIDQFEEVFTLCENEEERQTFMRLITDEATNTERLARVIWAMRGDFLDRCAAYPEPTTLINSTEPRTYIVPPFSLQELEEAIKKPAERHGVTFEEGLVSQILEDVEGQPGALPLLQYALSQLWRVCVENSASEQPQLTKKGYQEIGGVKGALNETANNLYQTRLPEDQAFIRDLFMQLVQVEEDKVARRPISWERLDAIANSPEQVQRVVGLLADQRLLVTDEKNVQVVHEALLSEWKRLARWIEENRDNIRLSRRLEEACREWVEFKNSDEALLTGALLTAIEEWEQNTNPKLPPLEAEYLQKSIEKRDREAQAKLEQERKLREAAEARAKAEAEKAQQEKARAQAEAERAQEAEARVIAQAAKVKAEKQRTQLAIGSGVLGVILVTFFGLLQFQLAKRAEAEALIASAQTLKDTNNQLEALTTSVDALHILKNVYINRKELLEQIQSIIYELKERNRLEIHKAGVLGVSFDYYGKLIASSGADNTIQIWSLEGKLLDTLPKQQSWVRNVRFSPNGKFLASAGFDNTVKLWSLERVGKDKLKHKLKYHLTEHTDYVYDVKFSSNGNTIASSSKDGTIRLWETSSGKLLEVLRDNTIPKDREYRIYSLDFNPEGTMLASTGYQDCNVNIWKLNNRGKKAPIALGRLEERHQDLVFAVKFSPNGNILASGSQDGTIKLWQTKDGKLIGTIDVNSRRTSIIYGLGFSHDGEVIASASDDETIKLWKVNDVRRSWKSDGTSFQNPFLTLKGHTKAVNRVEFNPQNNHVIVSVGDDNTARIWDVNLTNIDSSEQVYSTESLLKYSCTSLKNYLEINKILQKKRNVCEKYY